MPSLSEFQTRTLDVPEEFDLLLGGGRGGGKSYTLALLALRHCEQYKERARVLYVRKSYAGLRDFEALTRELFGEVYGTAATFNAAEHLWRMPTGSHFELAQLEGPGDYPKFQGRSFSLLLIDEAGQYASPDMLDLLRSNLRGPSGLPVRVVMAANPGGPGHAWIAKRYVFKSGPWKPFHEPKSKRTWVSCPSTYSGNEFIDRQQYADQLEASCPSDPELLRAWMHGDWTVARGAYFSTVIDEERNAVDHWQKLPDGWRETYLASDWGSSAPSATYLVAVSPGATVGDRYFARDSLVLIDEVAAVHPDNPNKGLGWTVRVTAEEISAMCKRWNVKPEGVLDDASFAKTGHGSGSIAQEFARAGVHFRPAKKADRLSGWQTMRRLLADAGKPDVPGLYVSRGCSYWWQTVPTLARDLKRVEDVDSSGPDHAADATRYGCLRQRQVVKVEPLWL